jgi:hypothetical protein
MRLVDFIVCDDIRHEVGAKMSLMGVYSDEMQVHVSPDASFALRFGVFLRFNMEKEDPRPDSVRFEIKYNKETVLLQEVQVDTKNAKKGINLAINIAQLMLKGFGELAVEVVLQFQGTPLATPYTTEVNIMPAPPSVAEPVA